MGLIMDIFNLLDNIKIVNFDFEGTQEELFCSSAWSEEVIVDSESIVKTNSIISGTAARKEFENYVVCKILNGICSEENVDFTDLVYNCIEMPKNQIPNTNVHKKNRKEYNDLQYNDYQIKIDDIDYREQFCKFEKMLANNGIVLVEMAGYSQYVLFRYMNSEGNKGYGFKNVLNAMITYKVKGITETTSVTEVGTNLRLGFEKVIYQIIKNIENSSSLIREKNDIDFNIKEIIIPSYLVAKLIDIFYFTCYMNNNRMGKIKIPEISGLISININDSYNQSVGGVIDGAGNELDVQCLCQNGKSFPYYNIKRRYDFRESIQFRLDKIRVFPGDDEISFYRQRHTLEITEMHGIEESFNPNSFEFMAFIKAKEYKEGKIINNVSINRKLNVIEILQGIIGIGPICKYELDGRILVPDVIVNRTCIAKENKVCI